MEYIHVPGKAHVCARPISEASRDAITITLGEHAGAGEAERPVQVSSKRESRAQGTTLCQGHCPHPTPQIRLQSQLLGEPSLIVPRQIQPVPVTALVTPEGDLGLLLV